MARKMRSYNLRRNIVSTILQAAILGIAYFGMPPPNRIRTEEVPIELKKRDETGYNPNKFMVMDIFDRGNRLCSIVSTTAVRDYFDPNNQYAERTRINREICQVPSDASALDVIVRVPYEPEQASVQHSMASCSRFSGSVRGWQANCQIDANGNSKAIYLVVYQNAPRASPAATKDHERQADRIDVLLKK